MHPNNLNDRSLYQMRMNQFLQEGGQPEMAAPNPGMEELLPTIKAALEQGASLAEIIITLAEQQVPIEAIAEAMQSMGVPQEEFVAAVEEIQASAQQGAPQQGPEGMPPEAQGAAVDPQMEEAQMQQMQEGMPLAQTGTEIYGPSEEQEPTPVVKPASNNYEESMLYTGENDPFVEFDATEAEPVETIKELEGDKRYDYKEVYDPATGAYSYYYKDKRGKNWKNAGAAGDQGYDSIRARVFGKDEQNWAEDDPRRIKHTEDLKEGYREMIKKKEQAPPSKKTVQSDLDKINSTDWSGLQLKVIQYPYGDSKNEPGHIEMALWDPKTKKFVQEKDGLVTHVNRWFGKAGKNGNPNLDQLSDEEMAKRHIQSAVINLTEDQIKDFVLKSQDYMGTEYGTFEKTARGKMADAWADLFNEKIPWSKVPLGDFKNKNAYDFGRSNCADGVCMSLGIPEDVEKTLRVGNVTSPYKVFDYITNNYDVSNVKKYKQPTEEEWVGGLIDELYPTLPSTVKNIIGNDHITDKNKKKLVNFAKGLDLQDMLQTPGALEEELVNFMLQDAQLPKMLYDQWINDPIKQNTPFDLSYEGIENIPGWWANRAEEAGDWIDDNIDVSWEGVKNIPGWWADVLGFEYGGEPGKYGNIIGKAQPGTEIRNVDLINEFNRKAAQEWNSRDWENKNRDWEKKQQLKKIFEQEREMLNRRDLLNPKPPMPVFENNKGISPVQFSFDPTKAQTGTESGRGALSGAARLRPTGYTKEELSSGSYSPNKVAKDIIDYFGGKGTQEKVLKNVDKTLSNMGIPISINQTPTEAWDNTVNWWADVFGFENGGEYAQAGKETGFGNFDPYLDANQPIVADNTRVDTGYSDQMNQLMQEVRDASKKGSKYRTTNPHDNAAALPVPLSELMRFFEQGMMQGMTPQQVQMELYNSGLVSEKDYDAVQGLVNRYMNALKPKTIPRPSQDPMMGMGMDMGIGTPMQAMGMQKNGGQPKEIELTTEQVAAIMAAGGSVKFL